MFVFGRKTRSGNTTIQMKKQLVVIGLSHKNTFANGHLPLTNAKETFTKHLQFLEIWLSMDCLTFTNVLKYIYLT